MPDYSLPAIASRLEAAQQARKVREDAFFAVRAIIRKYEIRNLNELNAILSCVQTSTKFEDEHVKTLAELLCDIDDAVNPAPVEADVPYSGRERGEFDAGTAGVRGRA